MNKVVHSFSSLFEKHHFGQKRKRLSNAGNFRWTYLILIGCLCWCCKPEKAIAPTKPPNIILAICDDMSFAHMSNLGCLEIHTPNIDALAANGVLFEHAYCSTPSCSPSRAAILTGRNGYELEQGGVLWGYLPAKFETYTDHLEKAGYAVGFTGKGWGPGSLEKANRDRNPAGYEFNTVQEMPFQELGNQGEIHDIDYASNFKKFLDDKPDDRPFCFWYGGFEPHRNYVAGIGERSGKNLEKVTVPPFLEDTETTRQDLLDYYFEIEWFDTQLGRIIDHAREAGELDNTLILVTSDNGMPFPRAKANLYEYGTHMPLIAFWPSTIKKSKKVTDFINLADIAPTVLEVSGIEVPETMSARSFLNKLIPNPAKPSKTDSDADFVVCYRERHAWSYPDGHTAPVRSIRKGNYLLIWNLRPEEYPAGHVLPEYNWNSYPFGDVDNGRSKEALISSYLAGDSVIFNRSFAPRPQYELYHVPDDPFNLNNLAYESEHQVTLKALKDKLETYLQATGDPRMTDAEGTIFRNTPYYASKGVATGGLFLEAWQALDSVQQRDAVQQKREQVAKSRATLEEIGWDFTTHEMD
ncbi:MAG: sulfatase [Bacteroidota bacterium]